MSPDTWPSRWPMAWAQLRRGALDAPWSQASWASVARRSAVVSAFTLAGVLTGRFDLFVFAAFGALQLGLDEAALPLRHLLRLVVVSTVLMTALAFVAMSLGGTWWTVPLLGAAAFVQGGTVGIGLLTRTAGIGALAMGVIFAGVKANPVTAASWLAIGCAAQAAFWLLVWHRERTLSVRLLLANSLRTIVRMVEQPQITGRDSNRASAEFDEARVLIAGSGVKWTGSALSVMDAANTLRRTTVAWRSLEQPGYAERLGVLARLSPLISALGEGPRHASPSPGPATASPWRVGQGLDRDIDALDAAVNRVGTPDDPPRPARGLRPVSWDWLRPATPEFRHGLRMALAIAIAQAVSLVLPVTHSFWVPLTCIFVVKPDWSFTVVRSAARLAGNLLAVVFVPFALLAAGRTVGLVVAVAVISAVAFRYFTANYILGSFGIAGTILVLDQTLASSDSLYASRILSTVIGAAIGLAVSAAIPSFRSREATDLLRAVVTGLTEWSSRVTAAIVRPGDYDEKAILDIGDDERANLIRLRPAVEGSLLEPWPSVDPRALSVALDAVERSHIALMALTFKARALNGSGRPGLDIRSEAVEVQGQLARAATTIGASMSEPSAMPSGEPSPPESEEDQAVSLQMVRLRQSARDLADATQWVAVPD